MLTTYEIMQDIYNVSEEKRKEYALVKYLKYFTNDIIEHFLVRHSSQYEYFKEFDFIDIENIEIELISISSEEIFTHIDYSNFCTARDESLSAFNIVADYDFWPQGTWKAPIVAVNLDGKLKVIDGNNRLRMLRCYLNFSDELKSKKHSLYLLKNKKVLS